MASLSISMAHHLMFISNMDYHNNHIYNYLRWRNIYDHYSLNLILSFGPKRADYDIPPEYLPKTLVGYGTGIQFMFIYNH